MSPRLRPRRGSPHRQTPYSDGPNDLKSPASPGACRGVRRPAGVTGMRRVPACRGCDDARRGRPLVPPIPTARFELVSMSLRVHASSCSPATSRAPRSRDRRHRPARPARPARRLPPVPDRRPHDRPGRAAVARPRDRPDRGGRHARIDRLVSASTPRPDPTDGSRSAIASSRVPPPGRRQRGRPRALRLGRQRARRRPLPGVHLARQRRVAGDRRAARLPRRSGVQIDDIDGEELVFELDGWPATRLTARVP